MTDETKPDLAQPIIQSEHEELLSLLRSLKRRLDGPAWGDQMVASLLDSLREHLDTHFTYEESEDGFDHLARRAPWTSDRIDALVAEHRRLMASACDLASRARSGPRTVPVWQELQNGFERLHDDLVAHESKEHDLLQEVYTQDIGDKD
ncbi:Hemerythrin HHE cation binding domain protein [Posidoniimonas polymericola]|uniref:Hemerythrin HHE cation binding domain protein n=1 Tax=Posidoniimonas polymericola TaxID=2528002 RepID=A0A5C5YFR0_9BACT|nr:hemerythrin domain-containing protein [Posidoniimonas polymericola]TWT74547.1 Hemerythrin HHE cation binding domain protein [Posidoniimonas polymericola]